MVWTAAPARYAVWRVRESDLKILVAIFAGTVMHRTVGVISRRNQSAVGDEVFIRGKALDTVYF